MHPDIVVCELLAVEAVTGKDKLKKCTVSDGEKEFTVVSNAPNVLPEKVGKRIVVARVGAEVSGMEEPIKKTNVGGVVSEGMLCDERMLGLCGNQIYGAFVAIDATLLDGVAMSVPHRSTEPARPRHCREMT